MQTLGASILYLYDLVLTLIMNELMHCIISVAIDLIVQTIRDLVANAEISPIGQPGFNPHFAGSSYHQHINSTGGSFSSTPATPVNQQREVPESYVLDSDDDEPMIRVRHLSDSGKDISYNRIIEYDD